MSNIVKICQNLSNTSLGNINNGQAQQFAASSNKGSRRKHAEIARSQGAARPLEKTGEDGRSRDGLVNPSAASNPQKLGLQNAPKDAKKANRVKPYAASAAHHNMKAMEDTETYGNHYGLLLRRSQKVSYQKIPESPLKSSRYLKIFQDISRYLKIFQDISRYLKISAKRAKEHTK